MRKMGRPKIDEPKDETLAIRVTEEEAARIKTFAEANSMSVSDWIRYRLLAQRNIWRCEGGMILVDTPDSLSRKQWERLAKFIAVIEPNQ